ncbi:hypothetical protein QTP88_019854 [Uroleucon formosanum]
MNSYNHFGSTSLTSQPSKQPDGPFSINNSAKADNWFASVSLAEELLKNHNLTLVATIKKNKREIPKEFLVTKNRELCSSYFGFQNNISIVSYMPRKNKIVLVLSTMHSSKTRDERSGLAKKPQIITFYYATKGAVDNMDRMTENYTVARRSNRWPLTVFYSILNIGAVNAQVIYHENSLTKYTRLQFLKILAKQLMDEQLQNRATILTLPKNNKTRLNIYGYKPTLQVTAAYQWLVVVPASSSGQSGHITVVATRTLQLVIHYSATVSSVISRKKLIKQLLREGVRELSLEMLNQLQRKQRRWWVRPWIQRREELGASSRLLQELKEEDPETYRNVLRMTAPQFQELLELVKPLVIVNKI